MRTLLIALPLSLSLLGCTSETVDELAGEVPEDDVVDGKADSAADGVYTYFSIRGDTRKCASPFCGGFHLGRVNRSSTTCHDGNSADSCYTPELDFSESGLSQDTQYKLTTAAAQGAFGDGVTALVRGRFAKNSLGPIEPQLGRFIVTEAWVAQSGSVSDGVFVKVHDNGLRCIAAPCPSLTEKALNTSRSASISEVDFSGAELGDEQIGNLMQHMFEPSGLIVAGDRFTFKISGRKGKGRTATAVFAKLTNATSCAGTTVSGPSEFVDSADGLQCEVPETHCPLFSPLPPDFCSDGRIVAGAPSFIASADGMECQLPSVHCVTKDQNACPQLSPRPPGWCADGTVVRGESNFISSSDGKECELPGVHCVTNDANACAL